jgi:DNA-binding winged helix-turn-helix (wHTH) protein
MTRFAFGPFLLDVGEATLHRRDRRIDLPPKAFDLLVVLVSRAGTLVRKDELLRSVWPDAVVEESNLSVTMSALRRALGDAGAWIETVPKRGYRFVAPVSVAPDVRMASVAVSAEAPLRVAIVDDHEIVRLGVRSVLRGDLSYVVVGEAADLDAADRLVRAERPDLLLLDMVVGSEESLDVLRRWIADAPEMRVVVLSMYAEDAHARRALAAGARAYVMKGNGLAQLVDALRAVREGGYWVSRRMASALAADVAAADRRRDS